MTPQGRSAASLAASFERLRQLGLAEHVAELEALGLTVIPPDKVGIDLAPRLLDEVTRIATERNDGIEPDFASGATHASITSPDGQLLTRLLPEAEVFEEAVTNPVALAFGRYLLGRDLRLHTCRSIIKGPGALPLFLHADQPVTDAEVLVFNATYLLTDYTRAGGALCYVPGSHRRRRPPLPSEDFSYDGHTFAEAYGRVERGEPVAWSDPPEAVPVEAPAGSVVMWHGNTWHGAYARTDPGLRVNLIVVYSRSALQPQESYTDIGAEVLARHDDHFARLLRIQDGSGAG